MHYGSKLELSFAARCPASWDEMEGDERVRHCTECQLNVYNVVEMTEDEALALFSEREGRVCVRVFQREDGTVLTKDCPVGVEKNDYQMVLGEPTPPPDWGRS
jgi:ATP-dependent 26S proteasome regulatory subunit